MKRPGIMRITVTVALATLAPLAGRPFRASADPLTTPQPASTPATRPLYTLSEAELGAYLGEVHETCPELTARVVKIGRQNIGQPYEIYLLGEFPFEELDPDPLYCLTKSDCVTFCEHTYAMALSSDWWGFLKTLQRLRYRDGIVGMVTRNHYTIADWDRNNGFLFEDLTGKLGDAKAAIPLKQVCRRARFFAQFGVGQDIPDEPIDDLYIPKDNVPAILGELRNADFVNIIRGDADSQYAGHTGLIALADDGTVDFLHSATPTVREQPLLDYLAKDQRSLGIKILRLRPDAQEIMARVLVDSPRATEISEAALRQALETRRAHAPATAKPPALDWRQALHLQAYRLQRDTPVDADLQRDLEAIDRRVAAKLEIPEEDRALGAFDLTDLRLAMVGPDRMSYGASVPKICILLAYFETHPETATDLPADVQRELGRMIKVSDNELAAKYGQLLGIERIQEVLQSPRYRLYDRKRQAGLWYGKHYGIAEPRHGDPVYDHSHAVTVRQCLRYYLMLEQGRLGSAAACTKIKEIFASPALELDNAKFVAGLQGRDLSLIRKSGTWEDWFLDTARIVHGQRVYLLAGMTHHPQGGAYLAEVAAAIDELLCGPNKEKPYTHVRIAQTDAAAFANGAASQAGVSLDDDGVLLHCPVGSADNPAAQAVYTSPVVESDTLFNEVVLSWNADAPPGVGYCLEARVGRRRDGSWSPYLYFADWGTDAPFPDRLLESPEGKIDTDYLIGPERFDRVQYRLRAFATPLPDGGNEHGATLRLRRVDLNLSDTTGRLTSVPRLESTAPTANWKRSLAVPYRSQRVERASLAGRICSPTSVSMVLAYRGAERPTEEVANRVFDKTWDIYGNWPRAVQTAYAYGLPGYLERFSAWHDVERYIANDQPLIISIRADEGELAGAPYESTEGHLLVVRGFDAGGRVLVNDPAARSREAGQTAYDRADLEKVWMKARGGTAYILLPPPAEARRTFPQPAQEKFVEVAAVDPRIVVDLRYATAKNFTGQQLYPDGARCLLRESVADRLKRVQDRLVKQGRGLKIHDGYRPLSVQRRMWEVKPDPQYVADPAKGSRHNRGAAVDVTLIDPAGHEVEMPTPYDDFTEAARRDYSGGSETSRANRKMLEEAMTAEGFQGLETEWWHFDAPNWEAYPIADVPMTR